MDVTRIYSRRWSDSELAAMKRVWVVLVGHFFQRFIGPDATVVDLGAGFCHFINAVKARRKIAIDANPNVRQYADKDVEVVISEDLTLPMLENDSVTHVFMSNFLEHLPSSKAVCDLLDVLRRKISPGGSVMILQPNFRYSGAAYFDFIDHRVVLTEKSLVEALELSGFSIHYLKKRFLPYTSKSRFPKSPALVRLYLMLPIFHRILGAQTFVVGKVEPQPDIKS